MEKNFEELGALVLNIAPKNSKYIILNARDLTDDGGFCSFKFDFIDSENIKNWFLPSDKSVVMELTEILHSLRASQLAEGGSFWSGCTFILNAETGSFEMDIKYPEENTEL